MTTTAPVQPSSVPDTDAHRWTILALLSFVELLGMSVWFTAGATAPALSARWQLDAGATAMLTTVVQLGFVVGTATAALLNLADVLPARRYLAVSAVCAAIANAALLIAPGYAFALVTRGFTGFFLAGVYPPAMKMAATWFRSGRGLAIGTVVGALTIGKALPYLSSALPGMEWQWVVTTSSIGALVAAALVAVGYRDGPFAFPQRRFSLRLVGTVLSNRPTRLAIGGYLGHMWELYAMWALSFLLLQAHFASRGISGDQATMLAGAWAFGFIAIGAVGCVLAGAWADRIGRENVAALAMVVSGACALAVGWLVGSSTWALVAVGLVWGFAVVADSAQFSALVTEVAPPHAVGTALTLQTSLGFLLTAASISLTIRLAETVGWGISCAQLAIGPALGIHAMIRLRSIRRHRLP